MSKPSKYLLQFLCASALIMLAAVALNFAVDPLQLFRPARFYQPMYSTDSRMQNAGLVRSQDFDTVFMGTSLAIHFKQSDIDRLLGVRSLKLRHHNGPLHTIPYGQLGAVTNLSRREQEVLDALLENLANKEIASRLNIAERTVKFHVSNLLSKFGVRRRADLILLTFQRRMAQQ